MAGYWISPTGEVHDVSLFMHQPFAISKGYRSIRDMTADGWIRAIDEGGLFGFQIWDLTNEHSLEIIEDFLFAKGPQYERFMARIETENPLDPSMLISDRQIMELGLKEAIERERRMRRIEPFGLTGFEPVLELQGEWVREVGALRVIERCWYDPEEDEFIYEAIRG